MHRRRPRGYFKAVVVGVLLYATAGPFPVTHAQVTADGTLGTAVNPVGATFEITGGTRPGGGTNLFHSFGSFSVGSGETANFINDSGLATTNILSRVTGGAPSDIFGTIQTTGFTGANLFLLNPAGILFGPTAQLNVDGSFHATTADYIKLGNTGGVFYANAAQPTVLSVAAPSAFGFLSANPASIDVQGELSGLEIPALAVPQGETLSLVGGTLNLGSAEVRDANGQISQDAMPANVAAPGGRVNLVSVASAGEAIFDGAGFDVDGFAQLGDINITGGDIRAFGSEFLFASVVDGKDVFIRGGRLVMNNGLVSPGLNAFFTPSPDGGGVDIRVSGDVTIAGTDVDFLSNVAPGVFTQAGNFLNPQLFPDAKVPDITIEAGGSFTLSGAASVKTDRLGPGAAAEVAIKADTVTVENGASIVSLNFFEGPGSNITINARQVTLSNDGTASPTGIAGISAQNLVHPSAQNLVFPCCGVIPPELILADAGSITVNAAETVTVSGDSLILADSLGLGRGGDITVNTGDLTLVGTGAESAGIKGQSVFAGNAGNITVNANGAIELRNGGQIAGTTAGSGTGSSVTISAGKGITFTGADSRIVNATAPLPSDQLNELFEFSFGKSFDTLRQELGLPADADMFDVLSALTGIPDLAAGDAGTLSVNTPVLTLNANTRIEMSTGWEGNAGVVQGNVGSLFLNNGGAINSRSGIQRLGGEVVVGSGNAGAINITASDATISGAESTISTSTLGDGDAGDVSLSANQVNIENGGSVTSTSGGTVNDQLFVGTGNAGIVLISATGPLTISGTDSTVSTTTSGAGAGGSIALSAGGDVQILDGGTVSADSLFGELGAGNTGSITITAGNSIVLSHGTISTQAVQADGGNIKLTAPNIVQLTDSEITTSISKEGGGNGGNINIDPEAVFLNRSKVIANAFTGSGGNIQITANNFIQSASSVVDASSQLGVQGTVVVESPENDVAGSLAQLPQSIVDVSGLLPERCAARHAGGAQNRFVVAGRGGLPTNPDNYLPSFSAGSTTLKTGNMPPPTMSRSEPGYINDTVVAMAGWGCPR